MWGWREERKKEGKERQKKEKRFLLSLAGTAPVGGGAHVGRLLVGISPPLTFSGAQSLQLIASLLLHSLAQSLHESSLISDGVILGEEERRIT